MAGSAVSFVAEKLSNLLIEEVILLQGVHDQVEWMERQLRWIQVFLRDADTKRRGHGVAYWVNQVREVALDAEDIVDTYLLKIHRHRMHDFIKRYAWILHKLPISHHIGIQIQGIKTRLCEIYEHRTMYGIDYSVSGMHEDILAVDKTVKEMRELAIRRDMNVAVGFEDDMNSIKKVLLDEEKKRRTVISVVGMGGLGKSTLAKMICEDNHVKENFIDRCALVSVSQCYTIGKILKDIVKKLANFGKELVNKDDEVEIRQKLPQFLEGGKYLIVLDDVWGTEVWTLIGPYLPDKENGSRVIITTRSMDVAKFAGPSTPPHRLKTLNEEKSWNLFIKIVFQDEEVEKACVGELKDLGKEIVKNCGGLPLALVVMGGLLSMKDRSVRVWLDVKDGFDWQESLEGEVSSKILALSYDALPQHLKSCFLYFSCFPEDLEIDVEKLVRLWVAEGFIPDEEKKQQRTKARTMEEIAEGWLEDLIQRCLIQVVEMSSSRRVLKCRVHDLLLDLAIREAEEVNFFHTYQKKVMSCASPLKTARRLALHPSTEAAYTLQEFSTPKLRTLLGFRSSISSLQFIKRLELLRVLDLEDAHCCRLPNDIGNIIHLRYLGLRTNKLERIPSTIRKLRNLQTFDLRENYDLKKLPDSVWEIKTLRHVLVEDNVRHPAAFKLGLVNLQSLKEARAGSWIQGLSMMRNLRLLAITCILPGHHHALSESLNSLLLLRSLELRGDRSVWELEREPLPRMVLALPNHRRLEELTLWGPLKCPEMDVTPDYRSDELPPNLNKLVLYESRLQQDPLLLLEKLPQLRWLEMNRAAYLGEVVACSAGGFAQLETLELCDLENIKKLSVEDGAMPHLNRLVIEFCEQLQELPHTLKSVPSS